MSPLAVCFWLELVNVGDYPCPDVSPVVPAGSRPCQLVDEAEPEDVRRFTFDAMGRVVRRVDACPPGYVEGTVCGIVWTRDEEGVPVAVEPLEPPLGPTLDLPAPAPWVTVRDGRGRVTERRHPPTGQVQRFEWRGSLPRHMVEMDGSEVTREVSYTHDREGRLLAIALVNVGVVDPRLRTHHTLLQWEGDRVARLASRWGDGSESARAFGYACPEAGVSAQPSRSP